ncbi:hypothetical protein H1230_28880 [Paenibacillus sp. 19GGS1-52]|uniref:hypothetical protein n=1 Tax=Paenibacillus sp. 19GGS1-52 TaxID=2758563 RepID=UPI001EFA76F4|nr:hypothetical protein [Paenibacillus sp. 19GGS1-52]ULO06922.1 hypothetical protein H1230_28880 [Paenibacillus sp. 19GGS1-52]
MEHEDKREEPGKFMGDGFEPAPTNVVGDWGNSDGFSLWDSKAGSPEEWLKDWEGRQKTHDMFHDSYD